MSAGAWREERLRALDGHGLVDDPAVTQEDDPVGPRGQLGVVGDDDRGHAPLAGGEDRGA